jgi:hypothetical protein
MNLAGDGSMTIAHTGMQMIIVAAENAAYVVMRNGTG